LDWVCVFDHVTGQTGNEELRERWRHPHSDKNGPECGNNTFFKVLCGIRRERNQGSDRAESKQQGELFQPPAIWGGIGLHAHFVMIRDASVV